MERSLLSNNAIISNFLITGVNVPVFHIKSKKEGNKLWCFCLSFLSSVHPTLSQQFPRYQKHRKSVLLATLHKRKPEVGVVGPFRNYLHNGASIQASLVQSCTVGDSHYRAKLRSHPTVVRKPERQIAMECTATLSVCHVQECTSGHRPRVSAHKSDRENLPVSNLLYNEGTIIHYTRDPFSACFGATVYTNGA